ncbi:ROK family protein [Paenarthrobacter nicotinovorans]|uniref:ROK family transcriptional regulator n=1 Tax=Paenarthrobacter nicotinovorans TaxID=29320 RepID=UPI0038006644
MELTDDHRLVLRAVKQQGGMSKAGIAAETGWARATVTQRVSELVEALWLEEVDAPVSGAGRGRPSTLYRLNSSSALIFVLSLGQTQATLALVDLQGTPMATRQVVFEPKSTAGIGVGIEEASEVARKASSFLQDLLTAARRRREDVRLCVIGKPGPVDPDHPNTPIAMAGWVSVGLRDVVEAEVGVPTLVENDANLMVLGSWDQEGRPSGSFVYVKVGVGLGAGIVIDGRLVRGRQGMAGEIGHIPVSARSDRQCACGQSSCVTQIADARAILRNLQQEGIDVEDLDDLAQLAVRGDPAAARVLRQAGRHIGEALLGMVSTLAPDTIMIGGRVSELGEHLVTGARETLYSRSIPALTAGMSVIASPDHREISLRGAANVGIEALIDRGVDLTGSLLPIAGS